MSSPNTYTPNDSRLTPINPSKYPWKPLPAPTHADAIVKVSMIPTSKIKGPRNVFTTLKEDGDEDEMVAPCWSFLVEKGDEGILWDMGLRDVSLRRPHVSV
jgi:hypothetical protein